MRKVTESQSFLIAVELGGAWPEWLSRPATAPRRVLSELEGEGPAAFALRASEELSRQALDIQGAVLVCNERTDSAQIEARRTLVRNIINRAGKSATLSLLAPEHASERLRAALEALVAEFGRRVRVHYGAAPKTEEVEAEVITRVA